MTTRSGTKVEKVKKIKSPEKSPEKAAIQKVDLAGVEDVVNDKELSAAVSADSRISFTINHGIFNTYRSRTQPPQSTGRTPTQVSELGFSKKKSSTQRTSSRSWRRSSKKL